MRMIWLCLLLVSCSSKLECKPGEGVGCQPLSYVNKLVDEDRLELHLNGTSQEMKIHYPK